jgi:hypothetical protein
MVLIAIRSLASFYALIPIGLWSRSMTGYRTAPSAIACGRRLGVNSGLPCLILVAAANIV